MAVECKSPNKSLHNAPPAPLELIRRHNLDLKKSLGQNLLIDTTHLARIAAAADLTPADSVLEIGPGLGALTHQLAERAGRVVAVELDQRLIPILREQFADQPHVSFVHADILELDPAEIMLNSTTEHDRTRPNTPRESFAHADIFELDPAEKTLNSTTKRDQTSPNKPGAAHYKVVANLPYYITSAVLRHILEAPQPPSLAVFLVQREVAQRIVAQPGAMSLLAVSVQFYALPRILSIVPAGAFLPRPKVDSCLVRLDLRPRPAVDDLAPARFFRVVRAGFGQRRKQLRNSLSAGLGCSKQQADLWLDAAGIDPSRRAQTLSLPEWGRLARTVHGAE